MRRKYQPIIESLIQRIDEASENFVETSDLDELWKYQALVTELEEIKDAITASERV